MSRGGPPTPQEQIDFLQGIQRLLEEGSFVATYKYALLHALADLCVLQGDDTGGPLTLATADIAERFVDLYWRQVVPFPAAEGTGVLRQNTGRQAAIVRHVAEARATYGGSLPAMKRNDAEWRRLVADVDRTVRTMPLWRLQTAGQERADFLYPNLGRGTEITLQPGVAYCFRAFYPLIVDLVEGAWAHFIRKINQPILGVGSDLRSFLFGQDRRSLERLRSLLKDVQSDRCFYCEAALPGVSEVDHFIAWRRYPLDLGHNFVLAHRRCNGAKADRLASVEHLQRWSERNQSRQADLAARLSDAGVPHDLDSTCTVAQWAYGQVERMGGQVWVEGGVLSALDEGWRSALAC